MRMYIFWVFWQSHASAASTIGTCFEVPIDGSKYVTSQLESYVFPLKLCLYENQARCSYKIEGPVGALGHPFSFKCLTLHFGWWMFQ